jgi:hypothetical protein
MLRELVRLTGDGGKGGGRKLAKMTVAVATKLRVAKGKGNHRFGHVTIPSQLATDNGTVRRRG